MNNSLYEKKEADALSQSEKTESWRIETDDLKAKMILDHSQSISSLVDVGCGWGQLLTRLQDKIPTLYGVDESKDRVLTLKKNPRFKIFESHSTSIPLNDQSVDAVLTSHILHEVALFGDHNDFNKTGQEFNRILKPKGVWFVIDHLDPGPGEVEIEISPQMMKQFNAFQTGFEYRTISAAVKENRVTLSKQDCHDFITKIWSIGTGAENLEFRETHTILNKEKIKNYLEDLPFVCDSWIPFNRIEKMMKFYGIKLINGEGWERQFFSILRKVG